MLDLLRCVAAGADNTEIKSVQQKKKKKKSKMDLSNKKMFSFYSGCIFHS